MVSILQLWAIILVVPLIPTFIASDGPLMVSSSRIPTIPRQMADFLAVRALYSARAMVVKLALIAQGRVPAYSFLSPVPTALSFRISKDFLIHLIIGKLNCFVTPPKSCRSGNASGGVTS
ncbi:hypothetical protein Tco_0666934 [Tanacetum coccineum]